ncbi:hypothetical protein O6H91_04G048400 [Diphasiastrum complanatum]|uniref:Uncharacterized protein n=1 Tax=Diphasiastrum complanatum TaxID=34168 RepID=A0ACC2DWI8_DIPCM|nr:hypothetical protein O6H91_04G048400 [Diphasiastrum complanatum]
MQQFPSPASTSSFSSFITSSSPSSDGSDELPTLLPPLAIDLKSSPSSSHGCGFCFKLFPQKPGSEPRPPRRMKNHAEHLLSSRQKSPNRPPKAKAGKMCECMAGISGDCAAICCCPLVLLHLLTLVLFKLPAAAARKLIAGIKKRLGPKTKCSDIEAEEGIRPSNLSPCWSCMEYVTEDVVDQTSVKLQDEKFLREYFDCKQLGFGQSS